MVVVFEIEIEFEVVVDPWLIAAIRRTSLFVLLLPLWECWA